MTRLRQPRLFAGFALIAGATVVAGLGIKGVATDSSSTPSTSDRTSPLNGTYTYQTIGSESVGPATHAYPAKTTIDVLQTGCGVRLRWNPLPQRSTTWTFCLVNGTITLRNLGVMNSGTSARGTYACTQHALRFSCTAQNGSATGRLVVAGETEVPTGDSNVSALEVGVIATLDGGTQGTETTDWWFVPSTLLPLRVTVSDQTSRKDATLGTMQYRENALLRLLSTTPRR